jgi:hypothetical protein
MRGFFIEIFWKKNLLSLVLTKKVAKKPLRSTSETWQQKSNTITDVAFWVKNTKTFLAFTKNASTNITLFA